MSIQRHLYGLDYVERNPPEEWTSLVIQSTLEDDALEATVAEQELNFSGNIAKYVIDTYLPTFGACNGLHYRIEVESEKTGLTKVVFDGYIDLLRWTLKSRESYQFSAPIRAFDRTATVFDRMAIVNQGFLRDKGFITNYDFVSVPVFRQAKITAEERGLILKGLLLEVTTIMLGIVQDILSAISDILGVSIPVGILEIIALFANVVLQVKMLADLIISYRDVLFPSIRYYKGLSIKTTLDKAFEYLGMTVDYGDIEEVLSKMVLMPSQNEFDGYSSADTVAGGGELKPDDYGYFITDLLIFVQDFFNGKQAVDGTTVHIKNKFDPFWNSAPEFTPLPLVNETTKQYGNGTKSNHLDDFYSTWYVSYATDATDPWTLTEKSGDSYEIHRELITELDPRTNCLHGLKEIKIPYAMAVRKNDTGTLWDIFLGINAQFDAYLNKMKDQIDEIIEYVSDLAEELSGDIPSQIEELLELTGLSDLIVVGNRIGTLKMQDNVTSVPKLVYLEPDGSGKIRIPSNFKDIIGGRAIYQNYYLKDSPADVNDYQGQRTAVNDWQINFGVDQYVQTQNNQNTEFEGKDAKFTDISWDTDKFHALTKLKVKEIFDTNITEVEINTP